MADHIAAFLAASSGPSTILPETAPATTVVVAKVARSGSSWLSSALRDLSSEADFQSEVLDKLQLIWQGKGATMSTKVKHSLESGVVAGTGRASKTEFSKR